jgi:predicted SpoU family rRNA methylase
MQRDIRFAAHVRATAAAIGGRVIVVDGTGTVAATVAEVARHFGLRPR